MKTLRRLVVRGHSVRYLDRGQGEPLVFVHNGGMDHRLWEAQVAHFAPGRRVIALDLPGFGASDAWPEGYTLAGYRRVLETLLREVVGGPASLVGCCVGGAVVLDLALAQPALVARAAMITIDTPRVNDAGILRPLMWLRRSAGLAGLLALARVRPARVAIGRVFSALQLGATARRDPAYRRYVRGLWARSPRNAETLLRTNYEGFAHLDRAQRPVAGPPLALLWGADNRVLPARCHAGFVARLRPEVEAIVPGAGYLVMRERPDVVNALLDRWLALPPYRAQTYVSHSAGASPRTAAK